MNDEDKSFYGSIIIACIIGIVVISYTIMSSPKYEEHFTELYFYGEKVGISDRTGEFMGHGVYMDGNEVFISSDGIDMGPFIRGSTILLDGEYWYLEDIADDQEELLFRKLPLEAAQGAVINGTYVVANHMNAGLDYTVTVFTPAEEKTESISVGSGDKEIFDFSITLPYVNEDGLEKTGEYEEEREDYTRLVENFGEFMRISLIDESGTFEQFWRAKVSISLNTGEEIHVWIILDDE